MPPSNIHLSKTFGDWLQANNCSIAATSYDSGQLFLIGQNKGKIGIIYRPFGAAMGLAYANHRLYIANKHRIFSLRNDGKDGSNFDAVFVPLEINILGGVDCHEIAMSNKGLIFVATEFSCVGALVSDGMLKSIWKPEFISRLVPEDRCHVNGIGLLDGDLALISLVGKSDIIHGWRKHRASGGMIYDIKTQSVIRNLSMPHSPRYHKGNIYYLDSGRGYLVCEGENKIFCPGFLRGLDFINNYAVVTVSLPRESIFHGLELQDNIENSGGEAWCGILIIDLDKEYICEYIRFTGETKEFFDCKILPDIYSPNAIAPDDAMLLNRVRFN